MKSSIIIPLQNSTPFSALYVDGDIGDNMAKAAEAGYDGVELAITRPAEVDAKRIKELLESHGLALSAITTGQAYGLEGIALTSPDEKLRQGAVERIKQHAELVGKLNPEAVVIIGLIRGEGGDEGDRDYLLPALKEIAEECSATRFAFEPINRYECSLINTVEEALKFLEEFDCPNIGLLFDTFHANIEEPSIAASIRAAGNRIFHVHVADSNRFVPGYGHINFEEVGAALRDINYQGFCSLESLLKPSPAACLQEAADFIKEL